MDVPDEPPTDPMTAHLLNSFRNVCRGRRFLTTMAGAFPLPLSAREINDWLEAHPSPMPRRELDEVLFALDQVSLAGDDEGDDDDDE